MRLLEASLGGRSVGGKSPNERKQHNDAEEEEERSIINQGNGRGTENQIRCYSYGI